MVEFEFAADAAVADDNVDFVVVAGAPVFILRSSAVSVGIVAGLRRLQRPSH